MKSTTSVCLVRSPVFLKHKAPPDHPECEQRLTSIYSLFDERADLAAIPVIEPSEASLQTLLKVHNKTIVEKLFSVAGKSGYLDADTYISPDSIQTARLAAGSCIEAARSIWTGLYKRGFCLIRPPGHHATPNEPMGFCLFNNSALAATALLEEKPNARLAIVDFDLHHGNGTQESFYANPNVLFISSHRHPFYPGTGNMQEVGEGPGKGATVNLPLGKKYGDEFFLALYSQVVGPILKAYQPEMILVSAGFDGHSQDPMQGFNLSTQAYGSIAEMLMVTADKICEGKILFILEGGYHPQALKNSVELILDKMIMQELSQKPFDQSFPEIENFRAFFQPFFQIR
ncbi:MAG: histone deacetylase [Deltaproteobacteria bacterium]|nr:histone deacetylase [Deltaproteobacteria bacterium]